MLTAFIDIAILLLNVVMWIIIIQVILSWLFAFNVLNAGSQGVRNFALALEKITAPLYAPLRKILPDFGGIDFAPLVVLILIQVLKRLLAGVAVQYTYGG